MMITTAVIGVGAMGRNHARVYSEMENVELVAVADTSEEAVRRVARVYHATPYTNYRRLLEHEQPDIVSIVVPTQAHVGASLAALDAGCHVLVEKPLAPTVEEGRAIIQRAAERDRKLTVGHVERFNPAVIELKRRLDAGELGRVFQIRVRRLGPFPTRVRDVGVVIDLATHDLDVIHYLVGAKVVRVFAETERRIHTEHEDLLSGLLKFDNGIIALLDINWLTPTKIRELSITGERGMFAVDYLTQDLYFYENDYTNGQWRTLGVLRGVGEGNMIRLKIKRREPLRVELESFVEAVVEDRPPVVSGEDGLAALALAQEVVRSGRENRVIYL